MAREVSQVLENPNGNGGGTVTVIATDNSGYQYVATRTWDYPYQREYAIRDATHEALNK